MAISECAGCGRVRGDVLEDLCYACWRRGSAEPAPEPEATDEQLVLF